jgi:hypothetical protein
VFPRNSFDVIHHSMNWIRFWYRFGFRRTGEKAGLVVSVQMPSASCSTSRGRSLPMSFAISVMQV